MHVKEVDWTVDIDRPKLWWPWSLGAQHLTDVEVQVVVDGGNSVIVIEHNLDVIKTADWVIDLGPDGGDRGGELIAVGTPEQVAKVRSSHTGRYLAPALRGEPIRSLE